MSWLDKLKQLKDRIFGSKMPKLLEGKILDEYLLEPEEDQSLPNLGKYISEHEAFVHSIKKQAQSLPEQQAKKQRELAKKAAYNCLADMVNEQLFDDKKYFGESSEKSQYRLQLEEHYKYYGHGTDVPEALVPENHIKVAREIQRSLAEKTHWVEGFGLMQDNELSNFLGKHKLDLNVILSQNNGAFLENISNRFMSSGHHFTEFNLMDTRGSAIDAMHQSVIQAFEAYVHEQEYDKN